MILYVSTKYGLTYRMIDKKLLDYIANLSYEELLNFVEMKYGKDNKIEFEKRLKKTYEREKTNPE